MERHHGAGILRVALEREHEGVAVDDAGRGRVQGADAGERRFHREGLCCTDHREIVAAIGQSALPDLLDCLQLGRVARDHELAAAPVRNAMADAVGIKKLPALDAQTCLQASGRIVEPRMDDLAVA